MSPPKPCCLARWRGKLRGPCHCGAGFEKSSSVSPPSSNSLGSTGRQQGLAAVRNVVFKMTLRRSRCFGNAPESFPEQHFSTRGRETVGKGHKRALRGKTWEPVAFPLRAGRAPAARGCLGPLCPHAGDEGAGSGLAISVYRWVLVQKKVGYNKKKGTENHWRQAIALFTGPGLRSQLSPF